MSDQTLRGIMFWIEFMDAGIAAFVLTGNFGAACGAASFVGAVLTFLDPHNG
jgi:hypothetical protein